MSAIVICVAGDVVTGTFWAVGNSCNPASRPVDGGILLSVNADMNGGRCAGQASQTRSQLSEQEYETEGRRRSEMQK